MVTTGVSVPLGVWAAAASAPMNWPPPMITGAAQPGQTLTASNGGWTGNPTAYAYQWQRCDNSGANCAAVAGATGQTYALAAVDLGSTLRVAVTATNSSGSTTADSPPTAVVIDPGALAGIRLLQSTAVQGSAVSSLSQAFPSDNTAGNLIIAFVRMSSTSQTVTITDTAGNVYTDAVSQAQTTDGHQIHIFYAANINGGPNSVTAAFSATNNHPWLAIYEYSGLKTSSPLDRVAHAQGGGTAPNSGATLTTTSTNELVFAGVGLPSSSASTITPGGGYTMLQEDPYPLGFSPAGNEGQMVSAAGAYSGAFTITSSENWSAVGATFVEAPLPVNTALPSITGTAQQGQALTASTGAWTGNPTSYTYQWQDCDSTGANCAPIPGATGQTYVLVAADAGATIRVAVTATNAVGSTTATSAATVVVQGPATAPVNTALPAITGTAQQGQMLTASTGTWTGNPTSYTYQWQDCDSTGANCAPITAATGQTYVLLAADVGATIRVAVTATNAVGSTTATSAATAVVIGPPVNTALPTITGTAQQGQALTASTGTWSGNPTSYAHQWLRCDSTGANCAPITGATGQTYVLLAGDVGATIRVAVTATNAVGSTTATSAATAVVIGPPVNTALPSITGTAQQGQTLTASTGAWSGNPTTYSYQWLRCDSTGANCAAITGATGQTYVLLAGDVGATIRVAVTATNPAGPTTATSAQTTAVQPPPVSVPVNTALPAITGTAQQGQTLTASTGAWTGSPTSYTYQWLRCDSTGTNCAAITAATGQTYVLVAGDVGSTIAVAVTATNAGGSTTATSAPTAVVIGPPVNTAVPSITGTAQQGQTLTASTGAWTGNPTSYTYQWQDCDSTGANCAPITGGTSSTYVLAASDVGATIRVAVTATNAVGSTTATSAQTTAVQPPPVSVPVNTALPAITGTAQQGQTLTAANGTWTGSPTAYAYQWQRCDSTGANCAAITGATGQTYVLVAADVGSTIAVAVTATNSAGSATASSAPTAVVIGPPVNAAVPSITGTAQQGQTLTASNGAWTGSPTSYAYQWQRCDSTGANCAAITAATGQNYVLVAADVGATIRVAVTAANSAGSTAATSAQTAVVTAAPTPPTITTTSLPNGTVNAAYTTTLAAGGGKTPYTWAIASGTLPAGLTLTPATGVISGTPAAAGTSSFTVKVTDANSLTATQALGITINPPPIALLQSNAVQGSNVASLSQAFGSNNTAGNLIIAFVRISTTSQTVTISDSAGNKYADAVSQVQTTDGHQIHIFYASNIKGGANTVKAAFSSANKRPWLAVYEYSGLNPTAPLDRTAHAQGNSNAPNSGLTATTSSANELVFAGLGLRSTSAATVAAGAGYALELQDNIQGGSRAATEDRVAASTGAYAGAFSLSASTYWSCAVATFKR